MIRSPLITELENQADTEANTTTETNMATQINNRPKRNVKPVLQPYATHANNKVESKKRVNNRLKVNKNSTDICVKAFGIMLSRVM